MILFVEVEGGAMFLISCLCDCRPTFCFLPLKPRLVGIFSACLWISHTETYQSGRGCRRKHMSKWRHLGMISVEMCCKNYEWIPYLRVLSQLICHKSSAVSTVFVGIWNFVSFRLMVVCRRQKWNDWFQLATSIKLSCRTALT